MKEELRFDDDKLLEIYNDIKLPKQGTASSMGMDFFIPDDITLYGGNSEVIPTGIRWVVNKADGNVGLIIVPRSGLGFKYGIKLEGSVFRKSAKEIEEIVRVCQKYNISLKEEIIYIE